MKTEKWTLKEFQQWMKEQIKPEKSKLSEAECRRVLNLPDGVESLKRLEVYAQGYVARMHEALMESYEAVHHVLGPEMFVQLAENYAIQYPSKDYNLSLAGRHLSAFLKQADVSQELPFLSDLALLEWSITEAFHSFQLPVSGIEMLGGLSSEDWEKIKIEFQPHVRIVSSVWPIWDIWNTRKEPVEKIKINLMDRPQRVLIYRNEWRVRCEPMDRTQFFLLEELMQSKTLGNVSENLVQETQGDLSEISRYFSHWVQNGMIARIYL